MDVESGRRGARRTVVRRPVRDAHRFAWEACMRGALRVLVATAAAVAAAGAVSEARAVACGDTLRGPVTLESDLTGCRGTGLRLVGAAQLDCAGHAISGSGAGEGIVLDRTSGAGVRGCRVSGFRTGIRVRGGDGNAIVDNEIAGNARYGIELAVATRANRIAENVVSGSGDEGMHVGGGADDNEIADNTFADNGEENLYLLSVRGGSVVGNAFGGARSAALYVKHSTDVLVADNAIQDRPIHVRGASSENRFVDNALEGAGFVFEAYREGGRGWTTPRDNQVEGGSVLGAATCFRFSGAQSNRVSGVTVDGCRALALERRGGVAATGNEVATERAAADR